MQAVVMGEENVKLVFGDLISFAVPLHPYVDGGIKMFYAQIPYRPVGKFLQPAAVTKENVFGRRDMKIRGCRPVGGSGLCQGGGKLITSFPCSIEINVEA